MLPTTFSNKAICFTTIQSLPRPISNTSDITSNSNDNTAKISNSFFSRLQFSEMDLINSLRNENKTRRIEQLIINGANPNFFDESGQTPLHIALGKKSWDICEMLIAAGTDLSKCSEYCPDIDLRARVQQSEYSRLTSLTSKRIGTIPSNSEKFEILKSILANIQDEEFIAKNWFNDIQKIDNVFGNFWIGQLGFLIRKKEYILALFLIVKFPQLVKKIEAQSINIKPIQESFDNLKSVLCCIKKIELPKHLEKTILEFIYPIPSQHLKHIVSLITL